MNVGFLQMKNNSSFWGGLLTAFAVFTAIDAYAQSPLKGVGDTAENFELVDAISEESQQLYDYRGSIVLLDFFFYW